MFPGSDCEILFMLQSFFCVYWSLHKCLQNKPRETLHLTAMKTHNEVHCFITVVQLEIRT